MSLSEKAADRPHVVLDTNVALDWLVFGDAAVAPLMRAVETGAVRWVICAPMREELSHMLCHASLAKWNPDCERSLSIFDSNSCVLSTPVPSMLARLRCTDPDDQVFIDLALAACARWLVTRDRALLKLGRRASSLGLTILRPDHWAADAWP